MGNDSFPFDRNLKGLAATSVDLGDYDNDGDPDILLTGGGPVSVVYRNDRNGIFVQQTSINLTNVYNGSAVWGDYDADGFLDILISGLYAAPDNILRPCTKLYHNNKNNTFTEHTASGLPDATQGKWVWGDYDNDHDLDLLFSGSLSTGPAVKLYRNNNAVHNTAPSVPLNIFTVIYNNRVSFRWDLSTDAETPQDGLNYNLFIGTSPEKTNILSPMADKSSGRRRVAALGNSYYYIENLPDGEYYWSIQAIDNSFAGSQFAPIQPFKVGSAFWPNSLVSYLTLDELTSGKYTDLIHDHNGVSSSPPLPVTGLVNGAQSFNGRTTQINIPAHPDFDFPKNCSFTVEFWYKGNKVPVKGKCIIGRFMSNPYSKWWVGLSPFDGRVVFYLSNPGASISRKGHSITDGKWHHVAASYNHINGAVILYIDGVFLGNTTQFFPYGFSSKTAPLNIGWSGWYDESYLEGTLDEVAIYNDELSRDEIKRHYNKGMAGSHYYDFPLSSPEIVSNPECTAIIGEKYTYDVDAKGNPAPLYSLTYSPDGMHINSATGVIEWTPSATGLYSVSVRVENGINPAVDQTFSLTVIDPASCPPGLISYWTLDEREKGFYQDAIGNNDGVSSDPPFPDAGRLSGGQTFEYGDFITIPANPSLDFQEEDSFSIEYWYKSNPNGMPAQGAVGRYIPELPARYYVGMNSGDGRARFYMSGGGSSAAINGPPARITDRIWHHIAAVRNGRTKIMKLYVDGALCGSVFKIFPVDFASPTANLQIGSVPGLATLYGTLDEIAIYNRELTAEEIFSHYNLGMNGYGYCDKFKIRKDQEILSSEQLIPAETVLYQNYPNPFNASTEIKFAVSKAGRVTVKIYNQLGEEISEAVNQDFEPGIYERHFDASHLASGIYFYRMQSGSFTSVRKFILLK